MSDSKKNAFSNLEKILGSTTLGLIITVTVFITKYYSHLDAFKDYQTDIKEQHSEMKADIKNNLSKIHDLELQYKGVSVTLGGLDRLNNGTTQKIIISPKKSETQVEFKDLGIDSIEREKQ